MIARDHRRRVAGREVQNGEDDQRHDRQHRDGGQDAADDVGEASVYVPPRRAHFFSMFQ